MDFTGMHKGRAAGGGLSLPATALAQGNFLGRQ
jgi:hypothetical protein